MRIPTRGNTLHHEVQGTDETVLYDEAGNQLLVLNEAAAAIWLLIDNKRTAGDIADVAAETLNGPRKEILEDIEVFLAELAEKKLITWHE